MKCFFCFGVFSKKLCSLGMWGDTTIQLVFLETNFWGVMGCDSPVVRIFPGWSTDYQSGVRGRRGQVGGSSPPTPPHCFCCPRASFLGRNHKNVQSPLLWKILEGEGNLDCIGWGIWDSCIPHVEILGPTETLVWIQATVFYTWLIYTWISHSKTIWHMLRYTPSGQLVFSL